MAKGTMSFEAGLKKLEKIVEDLENGELSLEKAIQKFQEGSDLAKHCRGILDETEKKVSLIMKDQAGHLTEKPFGEKGSNDA